MQTPLMKKRLEELADRAYQQGQIIYSRFLDPAQQGQSLQAARDACVDIRLEGGVPDAERRVAAFIPEGEEPLFPDFPIRCVRLSWAARFGSLSHRDLLGASLALLQDRSCFGDIAMGDGEAYLFVLRDRADFVLQGLTEAGHRPLQGELTQALPQLPQERLRTRADTVSAPRLDAMLASAFGLSRQQAQAKLSSGLVKVNHLEARQADALLRPGDLLSLRGHGRARLLELGDLTRKARIHVIWAYYDS